MIGVRVYAEMFYDFGVRDVYTSVAQQLDRVSSLRQIWDLDIWFHLIDADCFGANNLWQGRTVISPFLATEFCFTIILFCFGPMGKPGFLYSQSSFWPKRFQLQANWDCFSGGSRHLLFLVSQKAHHSWHLEVGLRASCRVLSGKLSDMHIRVHLMADFNV